MNSRLKVVTSHSGVTYGVKTIDVSGFVGSTNSADSTTPQVLPWKYALSLVTLPPAGMSAIVKSLPLVLALTSVLYVSLYSTTIFPSLQLATTLPVRLNFSSPHDLGRGFTSKPSVMVMSLGSSYPTIIPQSSKPSTYTFTSCFSLMSVCVRSVRWNVAVGSPADVSTGRV